MTLLRLVGLFLTLIAAVKYILRLRFVSCAILAPTSIPRCRLSQTLQSSCIFPYLPSPPIHRDKLPVHIISAWLHLGP